MPPCSRTGPAGSSAFELALEHAVPRIDPIERSARALRVLVVALDVQPQADAALAPAYKLHDTTLQRGRHALPAMRLGHAHI